jgi:hypothetical protein
MKLVSHELPAAALASISAGGWKISDHGDGQLGFFIAIVPW